MSAIRDEWTTEDGSIRLLLGDCLEILPQIGKVDACVTDPPYGIKPVSKFGTVEAVSFNENDVAWDVLPPKPLLNSLFEFETAIIWGAQYFDAPSSGRWLVWDKLNGNNPFADCEMAWTNLSGNNKVLRYQWIGAHARRIEQAYHPTQKPVALMEWCLGFLPDAETILDPFMGSGTTGVACIRLNRRFVGIEREPKYFEIAKKRIQNELAKTALIETPKKLVQTSFMEAVS